MRERLRAGCIGAIAIVVGAWWGTVPVAAAQAVTTGIIDGSAADESGGVLPGVTVTLRSPSRNTVVTSTTGTNGEFRFLAVAVGAYELKAELAGFNTVTVASVTVDPGSHQSFPIQMKVGTLEEAVVVTADVPLINTKDASEAVTLSDQYIASLPLITRNYTEMPTVFPGVSYNRGARTSYNQFNVRGGDQTGNNYLLDGGSLNRGVGRAGILVAPSVIEKVEVLPGGFTAEYGGYQSSVINLISKSGTNIPDTFVSFISKPNATVNSIQTGIQGQSRDVPPDSARFFEVSTGGPIRKDSLWYYAGFQYNEENQGTVLSPDPAPIVNKFYPTHFKLTNQHGPNDRWEYTADVGPFTADHTQLTPLVAPQSNTRQGIDTWNQTGRQTHLFNGNTFMETSFQVFFMTFHFDRVNDDEPLPAGAYFVNYFDPTLGHLYTSGPSATRSGVRDENRYRIASSLTRTLDRHSIKFGGELNETFGQQPSFRDIPQFTDFRLQPGGGPLLRLDPFAAYGSLRDQSAGAFVQDSWQALPNLTINGGVRVDTQRQSTDTMVFSPRAGVTWDPARNGRNKVFATVGRYYSNVFDNVFGFADTHPAQDITYSVRNAGANLNGISSIRSIQTFAIDNLENPYTNHFSAGYERLLTGTLKVTASVVARRGSHQPSGDAVTITPTTVEQVQRTAGRLNYNGLELTVQKAASRRFEGLISYTLGKAENDASGVLSPLQRQYSYGPADYDQRHTFNATGTVTLPWDLRATALVRIASGRPYSILNGDPNVLAAYVDPQGHITGRNQELQPANGTLDLNLSRELALPRGRLHLFAQIINLTDRTNIIAVSTSIFNPGAPTNVDIPREVQFGVDVRF